MTLVALLAVPLAGAGLLMRLRGDAARLAHGATALLTLALGLAVVRAVAVADRTALDGLLRVDALSAWMILVVTGVGTLAAVEAPRYAHGREHVLYPLLNLMIFTMLLAVTTDDVGLMWVAVEGTTLASVFLVNFERTRASLEAAYKYLLICSVGIAIAFLGTVLVYFADLTRAAGPFMHEASALRWTSLRELAPLLSPRVLELAFVFLVIGYGTKAGLAPMHTWLPDAHSEAPAPVSALMSGVLLSVGIYALLRFKPIVDVAVGPDFSRRILLTLGLVSLAVAAAFLWSAGNYKRMLAYSSVEHIGVVCLGLGFGGAWGIAGAILHIANHALAKSVLFLLAGRIRSAYGTAEIAGVRGLLGAMPATGRGFLAGLLALMGLPPFGLFTSEVMIFGAGFRAGYPITAALGLALLVVAFGGLLRAAHTMLYGTAPALPPVSGGGWAALPIAVALGLLVLTGVAWPPGLATALERIRLIVTP